MFPAFATKPHAARLTLALLSLVSGFRAPIAQAQALDGRQRGVVESVETLFGQVAKGVVYGGASMARFNSRLLCPLFGHETERDNEDQPTLFVFNNKLNREFAYRIYADDEISEQMTQEANFDARQMTLIFVHGWLGGIHNEIWLSEAKNAALKGSPFVGLSARSNQTGEQQHNSTTSDGFRPNVIIVDWSEFASGSLYAATKNSLKVSRRLGRLLEQLANAGKLKPELMHCFGHSIGTHICGQAARLAFPVQPRPAGALAVAQPRMGRITGLDPGGFCYELGIRNESTYPGLRPSDALLVDAYYSNRSPFGNRYQVGQYNVRINNGFFQQPCSVWRNPDVAVEYFRAAVRFSLGNVGHNDVLTCDHYFSTRFAHQLLTPVCSFVGYACDSYRNFMRGRCGSCNSPAQCYTMDFEFQRPNASTAHALEHTTRHSSYFNDLYDDLYEDDDSASSSSVSQPLGGVPYNKRLVYYMRVASEAPFCSSTFRVLVKLDEDVVDLSSFRSEWLKLRFLGPNEELISVFDGATSKTGELLTLNGPWPSASTDDYMELQGIDGSTLTALFEVPENNFATNLHKAGFLDKPLINDLIVEYDNELHRRQDPVGNPIESVRLEYLSSTDKKIRSKNSRIFRRNEFKIIYRHLGGADEQFASSNRRRVSGRK